MHDGTPECSFLRLRSYSLLYYLNTCYLVERHNASQSLRKNHMKSTCGFCVLFQFHMFIPHVSVMLRDGNPHESHMSLTCGDIWAHLDHMWHTRYAHVFAGPHICLTCEKYSSHVDKRVKLEQHMWDTCESMWATCEFNVTFL